MHLLASLHTHTPAVVHCEQGGIPAYTMPVGMHFSEHGENYIRMRLFDNKRIICFSFLVGCEGEHYLLVVRVYSVDT